MFTVMMINSSILPKHFDEPLSNPLEIVEGKKDEQKETQTPFGSRGINGYVHHDDFDGEKKAKSRNGPKTTTESSNLSTWMAPILRFKIVFHDFLYI